MRSFILAALFIFVLAPSAFAGTCGIGGTCKASCDTADTEAVAAGFSCQVTPFTPKCCVPTNTICVSPGLCQSGPTTARPNLNSDPNINCGATDKCYVPAPAAVVNTSNQPNGAGCLQSKECTSGYCDTTVGVCKTPPTGNSFGTVNSNTNGSSFGQVSNNSNSGTDVTLLNPLQGGNSLESFILSILDFIIRIGTIVVIFMLVFVGYKFVMAQGEPGALSEARSMLLWTVVGALILLGSKAIALGIEATVQALSTGG